MSNRIYVGYHGGFAGERRKLTVSWSVFFHADRFEIQNNATLLSTWQVVRSEPWAKVEVTLDDSGVTRGNVAALAAFGVLGLAGRTPTTLLSVNYIDGQLLFEWKRPYQLVRQEFASIIGSGTPMGNSIRLGFEDTRSASDLDVVGQIKGLGELLEAGLLSDDEFAAKKADLLRRL